MNATTNINMSFFLLIVLIQTCCINKVVHSKVLAKKLWPGEGYEVHVVNNLTNGAAPLWIHCASGDTELGTHKLHAKGDFHWSFRINYGLSTMFFCRFRWGGRNKAFEVFNKHVALYCEGPHEKEVGNICYWSVKEDGFWIGYAIPPPVLELLQVVVSRVLAKDLWPGEGYEVHVVNNLPNGTAPLRIHCASGDTELGTHKLHGKGDFHWSFRINYGFSTMFFCRFRWGGRNKAFEVFNKHVALYCEGPHEKEVGNICYWSVREDGFWIGYAIPSPLLEQMQLW